MTAPITPPTAPVPKAPIFTTMTIFGWLIVLSALAFGYLDIYKHSDRSPWAYIGAFALTLMGGWCIDRTPLVSFMQAITAAIAAWRGKRDA